jgi:hypothetical protein
VSAVDPNMSKSRDLLFSLCKYFRTHGMYMLLLEFQVMMRDWARAALTCIQLFKFSQDYPTKIQFLNLAKVILLFDFRILKD